MVVDIEDEFRGFSVLYCKENPVLYSIENIPLEDEI
jgi:hypothetical protein